MNLIDYMEDKVIRVFKPVLKYARDKGWCEDDKNQLNRLYQKSLKSCGVKSKQGVMTEYFKKKK